MQHAFNIKLRAADAAPRSIGNRLLDSGEAPTISALAHQLNLEPGWVAEVLRMTQLAPDIVQTVLNGAQPRHLNLHALRGRQAMVSQDWTEQRHVFGFMNG